jgi:hypothetical protein
MNCFRSGLHAIAAECPRADFSFRDLGSSGLTTPLATKEACVGSGAGDEWDRHGRGVRARWSGRSSAAMTLGGPV